MYLRLLLLLLIVVVGLVATNCSEIVELKAEFNGIQVQTAAVLQGLFNKSD